MEQRRICPYCMQELEAGEEQCPHCGRELAGHARLTGYATVGLRTAGSGLHEQLYEGYSAPEQYSTAEFEGRYTDEYSLAAVFYRMVCGLSPVGGFGSVPAA